MSRSTGLLNTRFERDVSIAEDSIPLCIPEIRGKEWEYVKECLDSNWVSSVGHFVDRFERLVADYVGTDYSVATVNGTAALHLALLVAGIQPDDEVLVSTLTFIAPANAIRYVGAWPVFVDADPEFWQMNPQQVHDFLKDGCQWRAGSLYNRATGRRVKGILPVHILGNPCDMDPILDLARKYNLVVIEDATESLGAKYRERRVGQIGDIACFSFNGNKIITTGGGGMLVTNNPKWAAKAKYLTTQAKDDTVEFVHGEVGYNYRLTNLQAAMGCAQMERLDEYIESKRHIASSYAEGLKRAPGLTLMKEAPWAYSTFWMYTILVDPSISGLGSRTLLHRLARKGIQTRPLWQPLHKSPAHEAACCFRPYVAERLNSQALSLPCSVGLEPVHLERVVEVILGIVNLEGGSN